MGRGNASCCEEKITLLTSSKESHEGILRTKNTKNSLSYCFFEIKNLTGKTCVWLYRSEGTQVYAMKNNLPSPPLNFPVSLSRSDHRQQFLVYSSIYPMHLQAFIFYLVNASMSLKLFSPCLYHLKFVLKMLHNIRERVCVLTLSYAFNG